MYNNKPIYDSAEIIHPMLDEAKGVFENLYILRRMIFSNFKTRYKRSYLGIVWSMLNPLLNMVVYVLIFSFLFNRNIEHFALYVLTGRMIFSYFSQSTSESMIQMVSKSKIMQRIYLPKSIYVLASVGINFINLVLTFIPFLLIAIFDQLTFQWTIIMIVPCLILVTLFNTGVSLMIATLIPFVNDFKQIWDVLLTLWMYLTPLFYPVSIIHPPLFLTIYKLNPLYIYVTIFREALIYGTVSSPYYWLVGSLMAVVAFGFGWWVFTKNSNEFAYRT